MSDGSEIWEGAINLFDRLHYRAKISDLIIEIKGLGKTCGHCDHWMKSSECKRESTLFTGGPSMNGHICDEVLETKWTTERRDKLQKELDRLLEKI